MRAEGGGWVAAHLADSTGPVREKRAVKGNRRGEGCGALWEVESLLRARGCGWGVCGTTTPSRHCGGCCVWGGASGGTAAPSPAGSLRGSRCGPGQGRHGSEGGSRGKGGDWEGGGVIPVNPPRNVWWLRRGSRSSETLREGRTCLREG